MLFVQILKQQTLNDLVGGRDACQYINEEPIPVALALTVKDIEVHMGSFKVATKGFCTPSLFGGKPTVSAKQAYLAADRHGKAWTSDNPPEKPVLQLVWTPALCIPDTSDRHVYFPLTVI